MSLTFSIGIEVNPDRELIVSPFSESFVMVEGKERAGLKPL